MERQAVGQAAAPWKTRKTTDASYPAAKEPAQPTHLADSGDAGHNGVLKELKLLPGLTEEEVDLIIITLQAAQALGNVG